MKDAPSSLERTQTLPELSGGAANHRDPPSPAQHPALPAVSPGEDPVSQPQFPLLCSGDRVALLG